jgi:DNA-binding response OmpR family regulator
MTTPENASHFLGAPVSRGMLAQTVAKKILIVEDDADIRRLLQLRLRTQQYESAFAGDAVTALTIARKEQPDLILLDLGLPGGDGFVVLERLQQLAPLAGIPVIVVSARDPSASRERALAAGAVAFLPKPIDMDDLFGAVRDALGE